MGRIDKLDKLATFSKPSTQNNGRQASPGDMKFDLDDLVINQYSRVILDFPAAGAEYPATTRVAFLTDDNFSIGVKSGFEEMYSGNLLEDATAAVAGDAAAQLVTKIKGMIQKGTQGQLKSVWQSVVSWTGSEKPTFSLSVLLVKYRKTLNPLNDAVYYMSRCMPTGGEVGFNLDSITMKAPGNFNPLDGTGMLNVKIGNWFDAKNQVLISADFDVSKEVSTDGTPLFLTGKISFEPYRAITHTEFRKYFPTARPDEPSYKP